MISNPEDLAEADVAKQLNNLLKSNGASEAASNATKWVLSVDGNKVKNEVAFYRLEYFKALSSLRNAVQSNVSLSFFISDLNIEQRERVVQDALTRINDESLSEDGPSALVSALIKDLFNGQITDILRLVKSFNIEDAPWRSLAGVEGGLKSFKPLKQLNIESQVCSQNSINQNCYRYVAVCALNVSYFRRFWPNIAMVMQHIRAEGALYRLHLVQDESNYDPDMDKLLKFFKSYYADCNSFEFSSEIPSPAYNHKSYFASCRFLIGQEYARKYECPIMFLDAEVIPAASDKFAIGANYVASTGTSMGIKQLFPWRRHLASEFVLYGGRGSHVLDKTVSHMSSYLSKGNYWFVDQNAIYWAVQGEPNVLITNRNTSGIPYRQFSHLAKK